MRAVRIGRSSVFEGATGAAGFISIWRFVLGYCALIERHQEPVYLTPIRVLVSDPWCSLGLPCVRVLAQGVHWTYPAHANKDRPWRQRAECLA